MSKASCYSAARQVGRDPRLSGPVLAPAIAAGMASQGVAVARFGPATTPAMFMSCILDGTALAAYPPPVAEGLFGSTTKPAGIGLSGAHEPDLHWLIW